MNAQAAGPAGSGSWRDAVWATIDQPWDVIVVGGGVIGAAVLREAARSGLRALLVEQRDFGWGTSSRSTKLVHGGFRYLSQGRLGLVAEGVRERQRLLAEGPGLVTPLGFLLASYQGDRPAPWLNQLGLALYDLLARRWDHQRYAPADFGFLAPNVRRQDLVAGLRSVEAITDDARLVLRLIQEAVAAGAVAINYVAATTLLREEDKVVGVRLEDAVGRRAVDARARAVINATGVWADHLREQIGTERRIRPLRGSHLVFAGWRLPVAQVIAFRHPLDKRYVSVVPWEGATLVGCTDLEHRASLDDEPAITAAEVSYLMAGLAATFPSLDLTLDDVVATFSGVRPVVDMNAHDPSAASREHFVIQEQGLVTVAGGKLTTFRPIALQALAVARLSLAGGPPPIPDQPCLDPIPPDFDAPLPIAVRHRLLGRYGAAAPALVAAASPQERQTVAGTPILWAELRWAARSERVIHLDDLLLRRVRLGLLVPEGGAALMPEIRQVCQAELGWDDTRWQVEAERYLQLCQTYYGLPDRRTIPDWREPLRDMAARQELETTARGRRSVRRRQWALLGALPLAGYLLRRSRQAWRRTR